ncbi:MAG: TerB N-terminal domain-containing protein [Anaerolineae bacterium]|nr:TerB N-terminal domain-containing protein [Anaerolineae bacterium]
MNILRSIDRLFSANLPVTVHMRIVPERVRVRVMRGDQMLSAPALLKLRSVPAPLMSFAQTHPHLDDDGILVTLPIALRLLKALRAQQSDQVNVDAAALNALRHVQPPADFRVHWRRNAADGLDRTLIGADGYLGDGWFYRQNGAWRPAMAITPAAVIWLDQVSIPNQKIPAFLHDGLPLFSSVDFRCDAALPKLKTVTFAADTPASIERKGDIPIPPRPTPIQPIQPNPVITPPTPRYDNSHAEKLFVTAAQKWVEREGAPCKPVAATYEFFSHDYMQVAQQRWYLYWRTEVRRGNYLPTDKPYLFLYVLEVLNRVGFTTPAAAFEQLEALWWHYRDQHYLDGVLLNWCADFLTLHKLTKKPLTWYGDALERGAVPMEKELAIEGWFASGRPINTMPMALIRLISDHNPLKSKFYEQVGINVIMESALGSAFEAIDSYLRLQTGHGLVDTYRPSGEQVVQRWPFGSALVAGRKREVVIGTVAPWLTASEFRDAVTGIVKYTENRLRRIHGFKSSLRDVAIDPAWAAVLDTLFPVPVEDSKPGKRVKAVSPESPLAGEEYAPWTIDDAAVASLTEQTARTQRILLEGLSEDDNEPPAVISLTDSTNATLPEPSNSTLQDMGDLLPEWAALAGLMQSIHWRALNVILSGEDVGKRLEGVARTAYTTPALLIDAINNFAFEAIGDLVIDTSAVPTVEDEDLDMMTALNAWAEAHNQ